MTGRLGADGEVLSLWEVSSAGWEGGLGAQRQSRRQSRRLRASQAALVTAARVPGRVAGRGLRV